MKEKLFFFMFLFFFIGFASAAMEPSKPFCEHQGYVFEKVGDGESREDFRCIFNDGKNCSSMDFYDGVCGENYRKEIPCRSEGEFLFSQFESCCNNLESSSGWWNNIIGQSHCEKKLKFFQKLWKFLF